MDMNKAFPKKYLAAADDLPEDGDLVVTIADVSMETLGQGADASEKPVVYFHEVEKGLVLNKTNATTICGLYGPETDDWAGKKIALFATEVDFKGQQTLSIRVRSRAPKGRAQPAHVDRNPTRTLIVEEAAKAKLAPIGTEEDAVDVPF